MENSAEYQVRVVLMDIFYMIIINPNINERYLHHYFTEKIQKAYPIIYNDLTKCKLHPEWATANQSRFNGGKYKKNGVKYEVDNNGTSGFIDFALGNYNNPEIGIEFKSIKSWHFQSVVFDFMKLMDSKNNLKTVISFSIIYRKKGLSNRLTLNKINETLTELTDRLNNRLNSKRTFLFWIIEIAYNSN